MKLVWLYILQLKTLPAQAEKTDLQSRAGAFPKVSDLVESKAAH